MNRPQRSPPCSLSAALLLSGLLSLGGVFAAPLGQPAGVPPDAPAHPFSIHDLDRDGRLSRDEYRQFLTGVERRRQSTVERGQGYPPPLRFEEIDGDGDGYLSEDEMISALNRRLERHKRYRGGRW